MVDRFVDRPRELLVAGHVNIDLFLSVPTFPPPDRTVPVLGTRKELGGPAANLALVASRYGVRVGVAALIGEGFPDEFRRRLEGGRVDLRALVRVAGRSTPTCFIVEDHRGHQRTLIDQGPMETPGAIPLPTLQFLTEYAWLHVTTGPPDRHLELVRKARRAGLRIAVDPAQEIHYRWDRHRFRTLLEGAEILFGNRSEIARAARLSDVADAARLTERVPLVIRTEGTDGATAFVPGARLHVPAIPPRRVRSIVGAGDAFRGGFYAAWFAGQSLERCLGAGARSASRWVEGTRR